MRRKLAIASVAGLVIAGLGLGALLSNRGGDRSPDEEQRTQAEAGRLAPVSKCAT